MLNKSFLKQNLLTKLSTKALRLIPTLEMLTDVDGTIFGSIEDLRQQDLMSSRIIPNALKECEQMGFISKNEDGTYTNKFHYVSSKEEKGFNYINVYEFFNDEKFKKKYKRSLNFFYYILTAKLPGKFHTVAAELLYNNAMNKDEVIIDYFQDFNDMNHTLSSLVSDGFLEVQVGPSLFSNPSVQGKENYLNVVKKAISDFCGKTPNKRKSRIKNKSDRHLLKIRVTEGLVSNATKTVYERRSTFKDLEAIALAHGYDLNDYDVNYLIEAYMLKKGLYDKFGKLGIKIYRKALNNYFSSQSHSFEEDLLSEKFVSILKKIFVMPYIQLELQQYFKSATEEQIMDFKKSTKINKDTSHYISFLSNEAYLDDLVLFEREAKNENELLYDFLIAHSSNWYEFNQKVKEIYLTEYRIGNDPARVIFLAKQRMLSNKERYKKDLDNKLEHDRFTRSKEDKPISKHVSYNWLEN